MVNYAMHLICPCKINLRSIVLWSTVLYIYHNSGHVAPFLCCWNEQPVNRTCELLLYVNYKYTIMFSGIDGSSQVWVFHTLSSVHLCLKFLLTQLSCLRVWKEFQPNSLVELIKSGFDKCQTKKSCWYVLLFLGNCFNSD